MLADYFVNSMGQFSGKKIEFVQGRLPLAGASTNDLLNSPNN
jgi:hypothetical protein